jgi:hypothetical protein
MDHVQEQHERAVGDCFMEWYNKRNGTEFHYDRRGADPPDLVYRSGTQELLLEITSSYYDENNAAMLWQNARGVRGAADLWMGKEPDQTLIKHINRMIAKKCSKPYPERCLLIVQIYPDLTDADEMNAMRDQIEIPERHPFAEIYVGGLFPSSSSGSPGGYYYAKVS